MRVLLNGVATIKPKTGVGHYISCLDTALRQLCGPRMMTLFPQRCLRDLASWGYQRLPKPRSAGPASSAATARRQYGPRDWAKAFTRQSAHAGLQAWFQLIARRGSFSLYHEPNFLPWRTDLPTVVTVHDLSVLVHPQWHPAERVRAYERSFFQGLAQAKHFIAGSAFTRQEMVQRLGIAAERVTAVHYGVREQFRPSPREHVHRSLRQWNLPEQYFLYVGTLEPRKNIEMLMKAFCELPPSLRGQCPLILVGGWGWNAHGLRHFHQTVGKAHGVIHLGYWPDDALPMLYQGAVGLFFPSFYEGFGLPPLEMLACGGAVVASQAEAHQEVLGQQALLLDAHDLPGWRRAFWQLGQDHDYRAELQREAQAHAARFTWRRCAQQTLAVYERVLATSKGLPRTSGLGHANQRIEERL